MRKNEKNKFRIINILLAMLLVLGIVGCSVEVSSAEVSSASSEDNDIKQDYVGEVNYNTIATFQDKETGVWYYIAYSHYTSVMIPRYNADGTLYTGN